MSQLCSISGEKIMEEPAIRHGVYVTAAYVLVFYASLVGQTIARKKTTRSYKARGEKVCQSEVLHGLDRVLRARTDCSMYLWGRILVHVRTMPHTLYAVARLRGRGVTFLLDFTVFG